MAVPAEDPPSGAARYALKKGRFSSHRKIVALVGEGDGRTCIDAGCASGYLAHELERNGWRVIGIEPDADAAREARRLGLEVVEADLDALDFARFSPYDAVVFGDVLEHLVAPERVVAAAASQLSRGGFMVLSVPNIAHVTVRLGLLLGRFDYTERGILDRTHTRFFTRKTFLAFLTACRLKVDVLTSTPPPIEEVFPRVGRPPLRWVPALANAASRAWPTLLAYQFLVKVRPTP